MMTIDDIHDVDSAAKFYLEHRKNMTPELGEMMFMLSGNPGELMQRLDEIDNQEGEEQ